MEYFDTPGGPIDFKKLRIRRAIQAYNAVADFPSFECIMSTRAELDGGYVENIVVDVSADIIQKPVVDVKFTERLVMSFPSDINQPPTVNALRLDFPKVGHLNLAPFETPVSLCLYDAPSDVILASWTAHEFLKRIHQWLSLTSRGELHQEDQALEPLFFTLARYDLIIPHNLYEEDERKGHKLIGTGIFREQEFATVRLEWCTPAEAKAKQEEGKEKPFYHALVIKGQPVVHGHIQNTPTNLQEAHQVLDGTGIDLIAAVRAHVKNIFLDDDKSQRQECLCILLMLPMLREQGDEDIESVDKIGLLLMSTIEDIGLEIGVLDKAQNLVEPRIVADETKDGSELKVTPMAIHEELTPERAAEYNLIDASEVCQNNILIGAGTLGSSMLQTFSKMGYGRWHIVDHDHFLPHNGARHVLPCFSAGYYKAWATAESLHRSTNYSDRFMPVSTCFDEVTKNPDGRGVLADADMIIDATATATVVRSLANDLEYSGARRVALFLSPSGNDSVYLCEDTARSSRIDNLEAQYYRSTIENKNLSNHLSVEHPPIQCTTTCRDVSNRIPYDSVVLHSSILTKAVRKSNQDKEARISIWRIDEDQGVEHNKVEAYKSRRQVCGSWTVIYDEGLVDKLSEMRENKLPNETGGCIMGYFDMQRNYIYAVDVMQAPIDSDENPRGFIRGTEGLGEALKTVDHVTSGVVSYVGEWHSHPKRAAVLPSGDDLKLLRYLAREMKYDGHPGVMLIVGDDRQTNWVIRDDNA